MKFTYRLKGLDCANCASKIERNIAKIVGVGPANLAFITERLVIEAEADPYDEILAAVRKIDPKIVVLRL